MIEENEQGQEKAEDQSAYSRQSSKVLESRRSSLINVYNYENDGQQKPEAMAETKNPTPLKAEDFFIYMPMAPDGGYAWVILLVSFTICACVDGMGLNAGIILNAIAHDLNLTTSEATSLSSIQNAIYMCSGPLVCAFANNFGFRLPAIIGGLTSAFGLLIGSYCSSWFQLFLSYGLITGLGYGFISSPNSLIVGNYFDKYRAIAFGVASSGVGAGTILFSFLNVLLLENLSWRNTLRVYFCICIFLTMIAFLFRPIKSINIIKVQKAPKPSFSSESLTLNESVIFANKTEEIVSEIKIEITESIEVPEKQVNRYVRFFRIIRDQMYKICCCHKIRKKSEIHVDKSVIEEPSTEQKEPKEPEPEAPEKVLIEKRPLFREDIFFEGQPPTETDESNDNEEDVGEDVIIQEPVILDELENDQINEEENEVVIKEFVLQKLDKEEEVKKETQIESRRSVKEKESEVTPQQSQYHVEEIRRTVKPKIDESDSQHQPRVEEIRRATVQPKVDETDSQHQPRVEEIRRATVQPKVEETTSQQELQVEEVQREASGPKIEVISSKQIDGYALESHRPTVTEQRSDIKQEEKARSTIFHLPKKRSSKPKFNKILCEIYIPPVIKKAIDLLFDMSIFESKSIRLFLISAFFVTLSNITPFLFVQKRGQVNGIPKYITNWFITTLGLTNFLFRFFGGILTTYIKVRNPLYIPTLFLFVAGIFVFIAGFVWVKSATFQFIWLSIFGSSTALFMSQRSFMIVYCIGIEKLTSAFGFSMLAFGLGAFFGTTFAGILVNTTGSYDAAFIFTGIGIILSSIFLYQCAITAYQEKLDKKRKTIR